MTERERLYMLGHKLFWKRRHQLYMLDIIIIIKNLGAY